MVADAPAATGAYGRRVLATSAALYVTALAIVLSWPVHVDGRGGLFRFEPVLDLLARVGIPAWASYPFVEFAANAALFLPLGVLWALVVDRWPAVLRVLTAGVLGATISVVAELGQGFLLAGRTMDSRDVAANAIGATIGAIATVLVMQVVRRRSRHREP
jgi:glycopeptide antibiotics resistance protein